MALRWNPQYPRPYAESLIEGMLSPVEKETMRLLFEGEAPKSTKLSDALCVYLSDHKKGANHRFRTNTERGIKEVTDVIGDLPLEEYTRDQARLVVEALAKGRKSATVKRRLKTILAVIAKGYLEFSLKTEHTAFKRLSIPNDGEDDLKREPFTRQELRTLADACYKAKDDVRCIVAVQMDTGARLGELVGLPKCDVFLDTLFPYIVIQAHPSLGRTIKTPASRRRVPLEGMALWGARLAMGLSGDSDWLFPRYAAAHNIKSDSASATLNKWIKSVIGGTKGTHSFRHAMKDRLRAANIGDDIQKALLGHDSLTQADSYGWGYEVPVLHEALRKVTLPYP
jgi:integrase